jgi:plasmid maintenance system antidote protein VapI
MDTFSDQLRVAIKNSGLTQYRLSQEAGINRSILTRFVSGQRGLTSDSIDRLMKCLGLELRPIEPKQKDK